MKDRITITLDPEIVRRGKRLARSKDTSLSGLIESLLREQGDPEPLRKPGTFSSRWSGRFKARSDSTDALLQSMRSKHGLE